MAGIQTEEVRAAAEAIDIVAAKVRQHSPGAVARVGTGIEGSASADAARNLARVWEDAYRDWAKRAEAHAQSMRGAAGLFDEADAHVADFWKQTPRGAV